MNQSVKTEHYDPSHITISFVPVHNRLRVVFFATIADAISSVNLLVKHVRNLAVPIISAVSW